jgi:alpha-tubulin suppressor-like RCC1 family protein
MTRLHRPTSALLAALGVAACGGGSLFDTGYHSIAGATDIVVPTAVATSVRFTDLAVGLHHACGITATGVVYCWGSNEYGQLGSMGPMAMCDHGAMPCSASPEPVASAEIFGGLAASLRHSCAVSTAGAAWCWGFGDGGQLGNGLSTSSTTPVQVAGVSAFTVVALGGSGLISCGIGPAGAGFCWGPGGGGGGLGDGTTGGANAPVAIAGGLAFTSLAVGDDHACGITSGGVAYCWGHNGYGKLGQGAPGASSVPSPVAGGLAFSNISAGLEHTCGLVADGSAYCWGNPLTVGSLVTDTTVLAPRPVAGGRHYTTLSAGMNHTCALDAAGVAWCWGQNMGGELGDGTHLDRAEPVTVSTSVRFVAIRAGGSTCALDAAGQAYCWGSNLFGQIGQPAAP